MAMEKTAKTVWERLYGAWDAGEFQPVYLFHGEEEYIKEETLKRLRSRVLPAGLEALNETVLEGAVSMERIIEAAETMPVMAERKLVVVKDWAPLLSARSKGEEENSKRLKEWIGDAPETTVLVFYVRGKANGNKSATKALKKYEELFSQLDDANLYRWIRQKVRASGAKIGPEACDALVFAAGRDLTRLLGEIGKLAAYAGRDGEITAQDVRGLVTPTTESTVFEMVDALTAGKYMQAETLLKTLLVMGEKRTRLLYMITRQIRLLYLTKEQLLAKKSQAEIQSALGLSPYPARKLVDQARRMDGKTLRVAYEECVEAEYAVKSGRWRDEAALEMVMLRLSRGLQ